MENLLQQITKPSDCLLAIALPMSEQAVAADLASPVKDLARHFLKSTNARDAADLWQNRGYGALIGRFKKSVGEMRGQGVLINESFSIADLAILPPIKVVILFAHYATGKGVELADGIHAPDQFAATIPARHRGIFDLTVCYSTMLQDAVKNRLPECVVIANERAADLQVRAVFFKHLIKMLASRPMNYVDACAELRLLLLSN